MGNVEVANIGGGSRRDTKEEVFTEVDVGNGAATTSSCDPRLEEEPKIQRLG